MQQFMELWNRWNRRNAVSPGEDVPDEPNPTELPLPNDKAPAPNDEASLPNDEALSPSGEAPAVAVDQESTATDQVPKKKSSKLSIRRGRSVRVASSTRISVIESRTSTSSLQAERFVLRAVLSTQGTFVSCLFVLVVEVMLVHQDGEVSIVGCFARSHEHPPHAPTAFRSPSPPALVHLL